MNVKQWLLHFFRGASAPEASEESWTELTVSDNGETITEKDESSPDKNISEGEARQSSTEDILLEEFPENKAVQEQDAIRDSGKTTKKYVDKRLLNALAGMCDPFEGEKALAEFLSLGRATTEKTIISFITGHRPCLNAYLKKILEYYPEESASFFSDHFEEIEPEKRLIFLSCGFGGSGEDVAAAVEKMLAEMDNDEIPRAFSVLAAIPSERGNDLLAAYLKDEDWRIALKAASALEKAGAKEKITAIREAAAGEEVPAEGFLEIARRMEGN